MDTDKMIELADNMAVAFKKKAHNSTKPSRRKLRITMKDRIRMEKSTFNRLYSEHQKKTA